jgi:hypothetical protein
VDFEAVDVLNDPNGRERLLAFGVRNVPVVARGTQFVFGQNLEDVAEFVGMQTGHTPLPPDQLIQKWIKVLRTAQVLIRQIPDDKITDRVIDNRDRSLRLLCHHVFRIGEAFLESATDGKEYAVQHANVPPKDGTFMTGREIAAYGDTVIAKLEKWWAGLADKSCTEKMATFYGMQPMHQLFERSTWHSAQHVRQLTHVLEDRFKIEPQTRLTPQDVAGLPLPERLFE